MDISQYAAASQRLLTYAELNKSDTAFSGEIIYIFDTAVLESYWMREPQSVGGRHGTDALLEPEVARYSGWLALKYLIENKLPKQKRDAYISTAHWNEALERVRHLETELRRKFVTDERISADELQSAATQLSGLGDHPSELLKKATNLNIGEIFTKIMQAVSYKERIQRVFLRGRNGDPSVRDLSACEYYWGAVGPKVRHQDFRRWHAAISENRRRIEASHGRDTGRSTRNIENDAHTLAAVQTMYRNTPDAIGKEPSVRFVLVTADGAIHEAYAQMNDRLADAGIPYFLRHPHVYSPLLNLANMAHQDLTRPQFEIIRSVFRNVEEALEPLLLSYDLRTPLARAYLTRLQHYVAVWSSTVQTICLANSQLVLADTCGDYVSVDELARILSTPDVREAAAASVSSSIREIRDGHLQVMSLVALESLERARDDLRSAPWSAQGYRAPVKLIGVDIAGTLGYRTETSESHSAWLENLLHSFRQSNSVETPSETLARVGTSWNDPARAPAAQLLASCIFFAANAWDSARLCADLCQASIRSRRKKRVWLREAKYCEALAIRMKLHSRQEVRRGIEILTQNIADNGDCLSSVRDRVERATLILTAAITQTIEDYLHQADQDTHFLDLIPRDELSSDVEDALADLEEALKQLPRFAREDGDTTASRIKLQALINRLGGLLYARIMDRPVINDEIETSDLGKARIDLLNILKAETIEPSLTANMYLLAAEAVVEEDPAAAVRLLSFLETDEVKSAAKSRPDEREVRFLKAHFERHAAGLSPLSDAV